uniref:GNAT family N-acetyltransferase n=1 Tax=uncultured Acidovorax sp. TaxID=158751 RepID=UPI0025D3DE81|nr:GNAT family N-acetyltransferase [uncultured Acidovorax sp.]
MWKIPWPWAKEQQSHAQCFRMETEWGKRDGRQLGSYKMRAYFGEHEIGVARGTYVNSIFKLDHIKVDEQYQSRGYGGCMIRELRAKARRRKCKEFVIIVNNANLNAIRLYRSLGAQQRQHALGMSEYYIANP